MENTRHYKAEEVLRESLLKAVRSSEVGDRVACLFDAERAASRLPTLKKDVRAQIVENVRTACVLAAVNEKLDEEQPIEHAVLALVGSIKSLGDEANAAVDNVTADAKCAIDLGLGVGERCLNLPVKIGLASLATILNATIFRDEGASSIDILLSALD
ncbi:MAG: hypothetical protein UT33_C0012G0058 [Candidatus Peregrinibacteria bacterium GW2011_GWC2_39_14]|nr:MAG: hypothetical protein US92_C0003G0085 [Candidatus Peregrinibacteria bacterium GW2011_GWA2_38_36]KKR05253.1 MAG: hypothetical protein UT33_C0012G0058 [Candidatus Peregrinibacteria bacterium GW2011_GWC2_39_14]